jgi:hypothetical protein
MNQQFVLKKLRYFNYSIIVFAGGFAEFEWVNGNARIDVVM